MYCVVVVGVNPSTRTGGHTTQHLAMRDVAAYEPMVVDNGLLL